MKKKPINPRARLGRFLTATILSLPSAQAAQISVNYDTAGSSTPAFAPADTAGVVPAANWNNVVNVNHSITFVDNSGASTPLTVALSAGGQDSWNTTGTPDERIFGDKVIMGNAPQTLTLNNVPYAKYDVYIYLSSWGGEVVNFGINGGPTVATLANSFVPQFTGGVDFVENDTYVKLSGLTASSVVLNMDATSDELHLAGFQIVEVIENDADLDDLPDSWELSQSGVTDLTDLNGKKTGPGPGFDTGDYDGDFDTDLAEYNAGTDPTDSNDVVDTDNDGLSDGWEVLLAGNLTSLNGNGIADFDGDGFTDLAEYQADPRSNPNNVASTPDDTDADGLSDSWELANFFDLASQNAIGDPDGDLDTNAAEEDAGTDPNNPASFVDTDTDSLGDGWEVSLAGNLTSLNGNGIADFDGDGFTDLAEYQATPRSNPNNVASTPNDSDADGLTDAWELANFGTLIAQTGAGDPDQDFDTNAAEEDAGTNPNDPASIVDTDTDSLGDGWEVSIAGNLTSLNGNGIADFDGDGFTDLAEYQANPRSNPNNAASTPNDSDADGLTDAWELTNFGTLIAQTGAGDPDGDFSINEAEETAGTNPNDAFSVPDSDNDGISDGYEMNLVANLTDLDGTLTAGNGPGAGTGDYDGDGYSDLQEFRYGSNAVLATSTPTPAISGNYETTGSSTPPLGANDIAGAFPVSKWNNMTTPNIAAGLVDSGNFSTPLTVAVSNGVLDSWNSLGNANNRLFGDKLVMGSGPRTITFGNVPYGKYDVYLYMSAWGSETVQFSVNGGPVVATLVNTVNPNVVTPGNELILNNTYVKLENITGSNVTITMNATAQEVHVGAFQIVQVEPLASGDGYADWIATFPGVGSETAFGDDADGDGIPNGLENVFGTDPSASSQGLVGMTLVAPGAFSFRHPQNATPANDVTLSYLWSTDLANWHADGATVGGTTVVFAPSPDTPSVGITTVNAVATGIIPARYFVRVEATLNP
jgi:hypothetical protein